jgi:hypothetical protein
MCSHTDATKTGLDMIGIHKTIGQKPTLIICEDNGIYTIRWNINGYFHHEIEFVLGEHFMQKTHGAKVPEVDTVFEVEDGRLVETQDHGGEKATVDYELKDDLKDLRLVYRVGNVKAVRRFHR